MAPLRVLFTSYPGFGHLLPMLPLARAAQRAGHRVVVATGADLAPHAERHGLAVWQVGLSARDSFAAVRASCPDVDTLPPSERTPLVAQHLFGGRPAEARAADLVPLAEAWSPDVVVHEPSEAAAPIVAVRTGARRLVHGLGPQAVAAGMLPLMEWAFRDLYANWQLPKLMDELNTATYLDICPPSLDSGGPRLWERVQPLRPASSEPANGERLPDAVGRLPFPDTIHVTLGTVFSHQPGVFETVLAGVVHLRANVVVTVGPDAEPARLGPQPSHVIVERFLPQALLFPRCRLVVAHGGAGTMLASLAHGLPQLLLPQGADQFSNAEACERAGAALVLTPGELTSDAVRLGVERLLGEPAFRDAAGRMRSEITAMPGPDQVVTLLWGARP